MDCFICGYSECRNRSFVLDERLGMVLIVVVVMLCDRNHVVWCFGA
jgi:hypothetical protein